MLKEDVALLFSAPLEIEADVKKNADLTQIVTETTNVASTVADALAWLLPHRTTINNHQLLYHL